MSAQFKCKGAHVAQAKAVIDELLGPTTFETMSEKYGPTWFFLSKSAWYELDQLLQLLTQTAERANLSLEEVTRRVASRNAEHDLSGFLVKFALRALAPVNVMSLMPRVWASFFEFGEVDVLKNEKGSVSIQTRGIPERYLQWIRGGWLGFLPTSLRVAGAKESSIDIVVTPPIRDEDGTYRLCANATYGS